jgi:flagellin-like hook-associated protein FlgL
MGEAIQTIKAADAGIEGIIDLIGTMKGLAKDAYSADATEAAALETQYDAMATQITNLAADASYGGMNLLDSDTLTVAFNEDGTNTMDVAVINALTIGADNLTAADTNEEGANMLMLQTRQSLGTTSLSLASQAAQSVLQLF